LTMAKAFPIERNGARLPSARCSVRKKTLDAADGFIDAVKSS
jgi:hypothetical protein